MASKKNYLIEALYLLVAGFVGALITMFVIMVVTGPERLNWEHMQNERFPPAPTSDLPFVITDENERHIADLVGEGAWLLLLQYEVERIGFILSGAVAGMVILFAIRWLCQPDKPPTLDSTDTTISKAKPMIKEAETSIISSPDAGETITIEEAQPVNEPHE